MQYPLRSFLLLLTVSCAQSSAPQSSTQSSLDQNACQNTQAPCVIEIVPYPGTPGLYEANYQLCCPSGTSGIAMEMSILEVTSAKGNWGDVTRWGICGYPYSEDFTHPLNSTAFPPWAILSTFDGHGGEISSCRTANAPLD